MKKILLVAVTCLFSLSALAAPKVFDESELEDLQLIAEARDWTLTQAKSQARVNAKAGRLATRMATEHPDKYVGIALSTLPGGKPTLYLKGVLDADLESDLFAENIHIIDRQPYSIQELKRRERRVHGMLVDDGYQDLMSSFDILDEGRIDVIVTRQSGDDLSIQTEKDFLNSLPSDLTNDVHITFQDEPVGTDLSYAYGGMLMQDGGRSECTSGWSVRDLYGKTGITTAGHCGGIDGVVHSSGNHYAPYMFQHRGVYGDIEWHTTSVTEYPYFYASAYSTRSVYSVEPTYSTVIGESICFYGRFSNSRNCNFDVEKLWVSCTVGGYSNSSLVQMNGNSAIPGDSGGGWSWGTRAYGSVKGTCSAGKAVFSHAGLYQKAIGVSVMTR